MILPWRVHVLVKDIPKFTESLEKVWDHTCGMESSGIPGRDIIVCYADDNEKSILSIKFDLIDDVRFKKEDVRN